MCLSPENDTTSAEITASLPANGDYIRFGITESPLKIWTNEPAECKWSKTSEKNYDEIENTMICNTTLFDADEIGWPCKTTLTDIQENENKIYIKCEDQPWRSEEEQNLRNVNPDDFIYILYSSENELKIDSVSPEGIIERGSEPTEITLQVQTSGGAEDGKSICRYNFLNNNWNGEFLNSNSKTHTQKFTTLTAKEYNVEISCEDSAGNSAT